MSEYERNYMMKLDRTDYFIRKQFARLIHANVPAVQIATTRMEYERLYKQYYANINNFWKLSYVVDGLKTHVDEVLGITDAVPDWAEPVEAYPKGVSDVE
jgi:hypothetical protein